MANNYEDVVGVIKVKLVTPVIRALFSVYNLDEKVPGAGLAYIASTDSDYSSAYWENMLPELEKLATYLKIPFEPSIHTRDGGYYDDNEAEVGFELSVMFNKFFEHFGNANNPAAIHYTKLLKVATAYDTPPLSWLFDIAQLMDDGHGLEYYQVDAAYRSSKPRIGEFGGWGEYRSHTYSSYISSHWNRIRAEEVEAGLVKKDYASIGNYMGTQFASVIHGIQDPEARECVANEAIKTISHIYNPIPETQPASNDENVSAYEKISVLMTVEEQHDLIAEQAFRIAQSWVERDPTVTPDQRVYGAVQDVLNFIETGDGAYIPPMQLTPVNPTNQLYDPRVYRDDPVSPELGHWEFNKPLPLATETQSLSRSFSEYVELFADRKAQAAKDFFGT